MIADNFGEHHEGEDGDKDALDLTVDELDEARDTLDRFEYLKLARQITPDQLSELWFELRFNSANSSQYGTYMNRFNRRTTELQRSLSKERSGSNFFTSFGSIFEEASNIPFCAETGLKYRTIGSINHPKYKRVRGSVDGYGKDSAGMMFVLETKTPTKRLPRKAIASSDYLYQVIQNIEIMNADYGLFNDVRLLVCPTKCITHIFRGYDAYTGKPMKTSFARYQYADLKWGRDNEFSSKNIKRPASDARPTNVICVGLIRDTDKYPLDKLEDLSPDKVDRSDEISPRVPGVINSRLWTKLKIHLSPEYLDDGVMNKPWVGNISDVYDRSHPIFTLENFEDMMINRLFRVIPYGYTREVGRETDEWANKIYHHIEYETGCFACMFFKVDAQIIQHIPRSGEFWKSQLLPIAMKWLNDVDYLQKTKDIESLIVEGAMDLEPPAPDGVKYKFHK